MMIILEVFWSSSLLKQVLQSWWSHFIRIKKKWRWVLLKDVDFNIHLINNTIDRSFYDTWGNQSFHIKEVNYIRVLAYIFSFFTLPKGRVCLNKPLWRCGPFIITSYRTQRLYLRLERSSSLNNITGFPKWRANCKNVQINLNIPVWFNLLPNKKLILWNGQVSPQFQG